MIGKRDQHHRSEHVTITLKQLVPQDHPVHKLDAVIDVDFIYRADEKLYSENTGRPSIDTILLIKMALLQYVFGIPSIRRTIKEIETNVAYRWFLDLGLERRYPISLRLGRTTFVAFRVQTSSRVFFIACSPKGSKSDS